MDKPMPIDVAFDAWNAARAAEHQATADLIASIEHAMKDDLVDAKLDFGRVLHWLLPVRERGLTETTRRGLLSAMELAKHNMGAR